MGNYGKKRIPFESYKKIFIIKPLHIEKFYIFMLYVDLIKDKL